LSIDACASDADCGGAAESCIWHVGCNSICMTSEDCLVGEECVGNPGMLPRYCLPAQCGCTSREMICRLEDETCFLTGWCTDIPCDGSVVAECNTTRPDPLPAFCSCPSCGWDVCASGTPVPLCPDGFTCTGVGATYPNSGHCACTSTHCQSP
jgi:hypothetical protein